MAEKPQFEVQAVKCYYSQWAIENNYPGVIYVCKTQEELDDCLSEMHDHTLAVEVIPIKGLRRETLHAWEYSLFKLGW